MESTKPADEEEGGAAAAKPLAETADIPVASNGSAAAGEVITGQHPSSTAQRLQAARSTAAQVVLPAAPLKWSHWVAGMKPALECAATTAPTGYCSILQALRPARIWQRVAEGADEVRSMLGQLFSPALRRTTLLLLFIWWSNAVVYYGLVLLATTVRFHSYS